MKVPILVLLPMMFNVNIVISDPQTANLMRQLGAKSIREIEAFACRFGKNMLHLEQNFNTQLLQSVADEGVQGNIWRFLSLADQFGEKLLVFTKSKFAEARSMMLNVGLSTKTKMIEALGDWINIPLVHHEILFQLITSLVEGYDRAYAVIDNSLNTFKTIHEKATTATKRLHLESLRASDCLLPFYQEQFRLAEGKACGDRE